MLYYFVVIFQAMVFFIIAFAYVKRDEVLWVMSAVLAGITAIMAYSIEIPSIGYREACPLLASANIGLMIICIVYFFIDAVSNYGPSFMMRAWKNAYKRKELIMKKLKRKQ